MLQLHLLGKANGPLDLAQWFLLALCRPWGMKPPEEPRPGKVERPPKLSRSEDARRIIQEYIDNLREIIKKLRRRLN